MAISFKHLMESIAEAKVVKAGDHKIEIKKEAGKWSIYVDGKLLDKYNKEQDAEKAVKEFIELLDI